MKQKPSCQPKFQISNFQRNIGQSRAPCCLLYALLKQRMLTLCMLIAHTHEIETLEFDVCQCFSGWWLLLHTVSITWNHQKIPFMLVPSENKAAFAVQKKTRIKLLLLLCLSLPHYSAIKHVCMSENVKKRNSTMGTDTRTKLWDISTLHIELMPNTVDHFMRRRERENVEME